MRSRYTHDDHDDSVPHGERTHSRPGRVLPRSQGSSSLAMSWGPDHWNLEGMLAFAAGMLLRVPGIRYVSPLHLQSVGKHTWHTLSLHRPCRRPTSTHRSGEVCRTPLASSCLSLAQIRDSIGHDKTCENRAKRGREHERLHARPIRQHVRAVEPTVPGLSYDTRDSGMTGTCLLKRKNKRLSTKKRLATLIMTVIAKSYGPR